MYLPRIVIDRWGWWGFLAFALPNIIGCTAFGYVVRTRNRSDRMVHRHRIGMLCFSAVTIAYHMFFVVWLFDELLPIPQRESFSPLGVAAIMFAIGLLFSFFTNRDWLGLAALVYSVSILAFFSVGGEGISAVEWSGRSSSSQLWMFLPLFVFGFLLCPYLDLTFHRALQHSASHHSFLIFGITFSIMILLTVAMWFAPTYMTEGWLPALIVTHLVAQCIFTIGAHLRELRLNATAGPTRIMLMVVPLFAAPLLYVARSLADSPDIGTDLYLGLLTLYGTALPAWFIVRQLTVRRNNS